MTLMLSVTWKVQVRHLPEVDRYNSVSVSYEYGTIISVNKPKNTYEIPYYLVQMDRTGYKCPFFEEELRVL